MLNLIPLDDSGLVQATRVSIRPYLMFADERRPSTLSIHPHQGDPS